MVTRIVWTGQAKTDVRSIEQPIAWQILKTLGRYVLTGERATRQRKGVTPPLIRLRAQDHRVFFRDYGDSLKIERVLATSGSPLIPPPNHSTPHHAAEHPAPVLGLLQSLASPRPARR